MTDTPDTSRETVERLTKWLRNWADAELAPTFQGDRAAHLGYIAAKQMDMLLARAEAAERRLGALREPGGFCTFCGRPQRLHAGQSCGGTPVYDAVTGEVL